jgi:hypothetical protein
MNNVNHQILDLYPHAIFFLRPDHDSSFCFFTFKSEGGFLAFILVYEQGCTQPAR